MILIVLFNFQLSELEQRVLEAEGRAEEAEDKVRLYFHLNFFFILYEQSPKFDIASERGNMTRYRLINTETAHKNCCCVRPFIYPSSRERSLIREKQPHVLRFLPSAYAATHYTTFPYPTIAQNRNTS